MEHAGEESGPAGVPVPRSADCAITQLAENGTSDSTIMAIAGHVSRRMLERYSHVRMEAKRNAMEAPAAPSTRTAGYDTNHDTNAQPASTRLIYVVGRVGGPSRDRPDVISEFCDLKKELG